MEAIGHHEFGKGLKPVDFDGWLGDAPSPNELSFWVRYWTAAYRFVLEHAGDSAVLLSYAQLIESPAATLAHLAEALSIPQDDLVAQADRIRPPRTHSVEEAQIPDRVSREASDLYDRMGRRAST